MKTSSLIKNLAVLGLCAGGAVSPLRAQIFYPASPDGAAVTPANIDPAVPAGVTQDWTSFSGTQNGATNDFYESFSGTSGKGFYTETAVAGTWQGQDDGTSSSAGWFSYGEDSDSDRSFGIHEQGGSGFGDTRLYLKLKNTGSTSLSRVLYSWRTEEWYDGTGRQNRYALKYNTSGTSGYSSQPDIAVATAPDASAPYGQTDGSTVAVVTSGLYILNVGGTNTPLAPNATGYFRWSYGTATGSGSGSANRDGLGIDDVEIKPLASGTDTTWVGSGSNWTGANWAGGFAWTGTVTGRDAVFSGSTPKTVNVDAGVQAVDLQFTADGYTVTNTANSLEVTGVVDVSGTNTATLSTNLTGSTVGLNKLGTGTLVISGSNTFTGGVTVYEGTAKLGASNPFPASNRLRSLATTDLNGNSVTVEGLTGIESATVTLGSGTLTLKPTSKAEYRGALSGTNGAIVVGSSADAKVTTIQAFQASTKAYTGATTVNNGVLEVSEQGYPNATSAVTVNGPIILSGTDTPVETDAKGELLLSSDLSGSEATYTLGSATITLAGGNLNAEKTANTGNGITLNNGVVFTTYSGTETGYDNRIYATGTGTVFTASGAVSGTANWRKQGTGTLVLASGSNNWVGELNLNNGTVKVPSTGSFSANGSLFFGDGDQAGRKLVMQKSITVKGLEGNVLDGLTGSGTNASAFALVDTGTSNTLTIDQPALVSGTVETKPSYQGDITCSGTTGTISKTGFGTTRLTRYPKTYTGAVTVDNGVLQISYDGQPTATTSITVNSSGTAVDTASGQVRLSSGGTSSPLVYNLGSSTLVLKSAQRGLNAGGITAGSGFGVEGGLRFDPDSSLGEKYATLASPVRVDAASDIHVNGTNSVLTITGQVSGTGSLDRTGGGAVEFEADNSGFSGNATLTNGTTVISETAALGDHPFGDGSGSFVVKTGAGLGSQGPAALNVSSLTVNTGGQLIYEGSNELTVVTGGATLQNGAVIDMSVASGTGARPVLTSDGTLTLSGTVSIIHPTYSGTATVSGNTLNVTLY